MNLVDPSSDSYKNSHRFSPYSIQNTLFDLWTSLPSWVMFDMSFPSLSTRQYAEQMKKLSRTQLASWVVIEICNSSALQSNTFNIYIYTYIHEQNWHVESRFTLGPLQNTAFNILQHEQTIWLSMLEKKTCLLQWSWCLQWIHFFCRTYYHFCTHTHTHTLFDTLTGFLWFITIVYVSPKTVFDIELTWVQFPGANYAFPEECSASFHAVHECFSKKNISRLNMHFFQK